MNLQNTLEARPRQQTIWRFIREAKTMRTFRIFNLTNHQSWEGKASDMWEALKIANMTLEDCRVTEYKRRKSTLEEQKRGHPETIGGWGKPWELK